MGLVELTIVSLMMNWADSASPLKRGWHAFGRDGGFFPADTGWFIELTPSLRGRNERGNLYNRTNEIASPANRGGLFLEMTDSYGLQLTNQTFKVFETLKAFKNKLQ
tara:strand:+ start:126 stop:446 length:321 start_codon:yes stop_codon:yes gene_type:complete